LIMEKGKEKFEDEKQQFEDLLTIL